MGEDPMGASPDYIAAELHNAVMVEREACARIVDRYAQFASCDWQCEAIARDIRRRGDHTIPQTNTDDQGVK